MAKSSKDATASAAKNDAKARALADPLTTRNLVRLLNILVLLLAITAFLLQLFAVLTHHWKWQLTNVHSLIHHSNRQYAYAAPSGDSRIDQQYGLFCRNVKVYANHDEQVNAWASTRFPREDKGEEELHHCLAETNTLRGSFLTCANRLNSAEYCHCRRYPHWNAVIFFEVTALIFLGLVVVICSLLTTQYHALLKQIGVALSFLAFLFLFIGLIIILSTLKRETRSIADSYPHIYSRLANQVANQQHHHQTVLHRVIRRQAHESYRPYTLSAGQQYLNLTHFYQSTADGWIVLPYESLRQYQQPSNAYVPRAQEATPQSTTAAPATTEGPLYSPYGPKPRIADVFNTTHANIGCSTVLSILAMILALLIPAILAYSWLTGKKLGPEVKTVTTTTVKTEYVPVPQEVTVETVPISKPIHTENIRQGPYDNYGGRPEHVVVRDDHPTTTATHTYRT